MDTVPEPPYPDELQRGRATDSYYQADQSKSLGRHKTIWKKIVVASASSLGILIVLDLWWGYRAIGYTKITDEYVNRKYRYSMQIPAGWTLATQVMQSLQSGLETWWAMNLYTYKNADFALVSRWDANVERALSQAIDRSSLKGSPIPYAKMLTGSAILVDVSGGLDLQTAKSMSARKSPASKGPIVQNVRSIMLASGIEAVRYQAANEDHPEYPIETVYIPYPMHATNAVGDRVEGVSIRTLHDEVFSEDVFSRLYQSFTYSH